MKVSERIRAIHIPFKLPLGPDRALDRSVYSYLLIGRRVCVIDAGVSAFSERLFGILAREDRKPADVSWLVLTHGHPDHVGGAQRIRETTGCWVMAHADDAAWIEDVDLQARERPVPGFAALVEGSVPVDRRLADGDRVTLGDAGTLTVLHTPGHSSGHIALHYEPEGALFSGDAVPLPGQLPIYDNPLAAIRSIRRLQSLAGIRVLLSSWDEPRRGAQIKEAFEEGNRYLRRIHATVLRERDTDPSGDIQALTARVLGALGFNEIPGNPLLLRTIEAHMRVGEHPDLSG